MNRATLIKSVCVTIILFTVFGLADKHPIISVAIATSAMAVWAIIQNDCDNKEEASRGEKNG